MQNRISEMLNLNKEENLGNSTDENNTEIKDEEELQEAASMEMTIPQISQPQEEVVPIQKIKKVCTYIAYRLMNSMYSFDL